MQTLKQNIINLFGADGEKWILSLPEITKSLASFWGLNGLSPVENLTYNYVVKANDANNVQVVIKISPTKEMIIEDGGCPKSPLKMATSVYKLLE